jgi:putative Ca2+/H+ antiporter (TMEM165/GDT1 family)
MPDNSGMSTTTQLQAFFTVFISVFLAELGDKTQLATMLFASNSESTASKWTVFLAASAALTVSAAIGVLAGSLVGKYVNPRTLQIVAGMGFVLIGTWTLWQAFKA